MFVDVGFGCTAHASWLRSEPSPVVGHFRLGVTVARVGVCNAIETMRERFHNALAMHQRCITRVYIEGAGLWGDSLKSQTSAARGDTFKLAYLVGAYVAEVQRMGMCAIIVDAREWKGTLSKEGTKLRVARIMGDVDKYNEHEIDAVAFGLSFVEAVWKLKRGLHD